jgi:hypothetical protein
VVYLAGMDDSGHTQRPQRAFAAHVPAAIGWKAILVYVEGETVSFDLRHIEFWGIQAPVLGVCDFTSGIDLGVLAKGFQGPFLPCVWAGTDIVVLSDLNGFWGLSRPGETVQQVADRINRRAHEILASLRPQSSEVKGSSTDSSGSSEIPGE